jgi:hypothetical protein
MKWNEMSGWTKLFLYENDIKNRGLKLSEVDLIILWNTLKMIFSWFYISFYFYYRRYLLNIIISMFLTNIKIQSWNIFIYWVCHIFSHILSSIKIQIHNIVIIIYIYQESNMFLTILYLLHTRGIHILICFLIIFIITSSSSISH